jgi:hypothetical protein
VGLPVLGLDVGGVIVDRSGEEGDTSFFGDRPMETPAVEGAFEAIARLCNGPFAGRVHIISKAGPKISRLTREWLVHTNFYDQTGVRPENLRFVRHRHEKAPICDELGVTHFVDDRLSVLEHLGNVPHRYLFSGGLGQHSPPGEIPTWATASDRWPDLADLIVAQLD